MRQSIRIIVQDSNGNGLAFADATMPIGVSMVNLRYWALAYVRYALAGAVPDITNVNSATAEAFFNRVGGRPSFQRGVPRPGVREVLVEVECKVKARAVRVGR